MPNTNDKNRHIPTINFNFKKIAKIYTWTFLLINSTVNVLFQIHSLPTAHVLFTHLESSLANTARHNSIPEMRRFNFLEIRKAAQHKNVLSFIGVGVWIKVHLTLKTDENEWYWTAKLEGLGSYPDFDSWFTDNPFQNFHLVCLRKKVTKMYFLRISRILRNLWNI
jgi:hypothetical protein